MKQIIFKKVKNREMEMSEFFLMIQYIKSSYYVNIY